MRILNQAGQSMTEYLVVLGVTGAALLASTEDVTKIFDRIGASYSTQSTEMNKVQLYNSHKVRYRETLDEVSDEDDDGTPGSPGDIPETPEVPSLPYIETIYDAQGNLIGQVLDNKLIGADGKEIAGCERTISGECVFVDAQGNIVHSGSTSIPGYVDDKGNALPVVALIKDGDSSTLYGFAYLYNNKLYSLAERKLITEYTQGPVAQPIMIVSGGIPQVSGYAVGDQVYSMASVFVAGKQVRADEVVEWVGVFNVPAQNSKWNKIKPCLLMTANWAGNFNAGMDLAGSAESWFNDPSKNRFLNVEAAGCPANRTVTYDSARQKWMLTSEP